MHCAYTSMVFQNIPNLLFGTYIGCGAWDMKLFATQRRFSIVRGLQNVNCVVVLSSKSLIWKITNINFDWC